MGTRNQLAAARWSGAMMDNFGMPAVELVAATAPSSQTPTARTTWTCSVASRSTPSGHAHPAVVAAVTEQISTLGHVSNFFTHPNVLDAGRTVAATRRRQRRRPGAVLQLRRRGQRGGVQDRPADRPAPDRRRRGGVPRPDDGRAGPDRPTGETGAVRADAGRSGVRTVRRCRRRWPPRSTTRSPRCSWSRSWARPGSSRPPTATWPPPARSPAQQARCWSSTRCRPASAAPERGSRTSAPGSGPTWSRWPRVSAEVCRSAR